MVNVRAGVHHPGEGLQNVIRLLLRAVHVSVNHVSALKINDGIMAKNYMYAVVLNFQKIRYSFEVLKKKLRIIQAGVVVPADQVLFSLQP